MNKLDLTGQRFGRLYVVERNNQMSKEQHRSIWTCKCDCGNTINILGSQLTSKHTKSCGCLRSEMTASKNYTHGLSHTKLYGVWQSMIARCYNKNIDAYKYYGGRGIGVDDEWRDFTKFYEWAVASGYRDDLTLDRIDVNGNYTQSNCRWATRETQANNTRRNRYLVLNGETVTLAEACKKLCLNYDTIHSRVLRGDSIDEALSKPIKNADTVRYNGCDVGLCQLCREYGIDQSTVRYRIKHGMNLHDALTVKPSHRNRLVIT